MSEEHLYSQAKSKVKSRKKFYSHVITWILLSILFIFINLFTSDYFWAIFPILAWGIGVAFHGIQVFSDEWEEQEVEREFNKMKNRNYQSMDRSDPEDVVKTRSEADRDFV